MHARVLGYLILHAPNRTAEEEVAENIVSCAGNREILDELGASFVKGFINSFRKSKDRTPIPSYHPSRPSFDREREVMSAQLEAAPIEHKDAKAQALIRDGYRCVITGVYDLLAESQLGISPEQVDAVGEVNTQCAHIVPASTHFNAGVDEQGEPTHKNKLAASMLSVLKRFGYPVETLNGTGVHSLVNIMTLQSDVHDLFDRLQLWLEATVSILLSPRQNLLFQQLSVSGNPASLSDPHRFPLPSPELLALHATCAKVANLSGAAEYLDKVDRDLEELDVLKANGDSSELLDVAIWRALGSRIDVGA
ncbi:hypothetical protein BDN71DRAFT_1397947 [Pleurotus eryngii]|uniref:HNH nuclease domain-containing protein n=1 Tax=Pleurotus eryngii TaxID=5323 RepID=A0A9P5ZQF7_PLEER|nr:hypothetical protein BDN71DRAFT_1397947 [Pleurotus eryngii]